jgi:tRNA dimethylallyltransferase
VTTSPEALVITGPTSSGKTALSIPVARQCNGEIISMDSRQVYQGMDIGTDKASPQARGEVPHWGLDVVDPSVRYSAAAWAAMARETMKEIRMRGRTPILVGGTGFYLRALTHPVFREPPMDRGRRRALERWLGERPREELEAWLDELDPDRSLLAQEGGRQRMIRTLEVALLTGRPLSWWHRNAPPQDEPVPLAVVRLELPRDLLYRRINERAEEMFRSGLLQEVERLLAAGFTPQDPGMTATGYREAAKVLAGELSVEEAVLAGQRATRRYARRQITWFRHQLPERWVHHLDATLSLEEQVARVVEWWERIGPEVEG